MSRAVRHAPPRLAPWCRTTLGVGVLALATTGAWAASFTAGVSSASGNIQVSGPTNEDFQQGAGAVQASSSSQSTENNPGGSSSGISNSSSNASSMAAPGGMRLLTNAGVNMLSTNGGAAGGQATGSADASINDSFMLTALGCTVAANCANGAVGTMSFSIRFDANLGGGGTYNTSTPDGGNGGYSVLGEWNASGSAGSGIDGVSWLRGEYSASDQRGMPLTSSTGGGAGLQTFVMSFEFGSTISLQMRAHAVAQAGVGYDFYASQDGNGGSSADAAFTADLGHTIAWNGISEVRDASGALVTNFSARSADSGYDYAQAFAAPVPEPETWALMAAGLVFVVWRRRGSGRG